MNRQHVLHEPPEWRTGGWGCEILKIGSSDSLEPAQDEGKYRLSLYHYQTRQACRGMSAHHVLPIYQRHEGRGRSPPGKFTVKFFCLSRCRSRQCNLVCSPLVIDPTTSRSQGCPAPSVRRPHRDDELMAIWERVSGIMRIPPTGVHSQGPAEIGPLHRTEEPTMPSYAPTCLPMCPRIGGYWPPHTASLPHPLPSLPRHLKIEPVEFFQTPHGDEII